MLPSYDFVIPDDDVIEIGDLRLRTIHTPGHTPGSTCFLLEGHPIVFSGDTLFPGGPGNTTFEDAELRHDHRVDRPPPVHTAARARWCCRATGSTRPSPSESPHLDEWITPRLVAGQAEIPAVRLVCGHRPLSGGPAGSPRGPLPTSLDPLVEVRALAADGRVEAVARAARASRRAA